MSDLKVPNINNVMLAGRLTRDPELSTMPTGTPVCKFGIAVTRNYKHQDGSRTEDTMFINVTAWTKTAEYVGKYLKKGRPVVVEGRLQSRTWDDKTTGQKRTAMDVVAERVQALDWDGDGSARGTTQAAQQTRTAPVVEDVDSGYDDIPF